MLVVIQMPSVLPWCCDGGLVPNYAKRHLTGSLVSVRAPALDDHMVIQEGQRLLKSAVRKQK